MRKGRLITFFLKKLLRSERSGWSNLTGSEPLPTKEDMPPPPGYEWAEDKWHLDVTGPWTDEHLGIAVSWKTKVMKRVSETYR